MHIPAHTCMCVRIPTHMRAHPSHVHTMHMCSYVHISAHTCTHTLTCARNAHVPICARMSRTCMHMCAHTLTCAHTCAHDAHALTHACTCVHTRSCVHAHAHTHKDRTPLTNPWEGCHLFSEHEAGALKGCGHQEVGGSAPPPAASGSLSSGVTGLFGCA